MVAVPWAGGWYKGTSGDTKPDHAGLDGWHFFETDTGNVYYHNGSSWTLILGEGKANTFTAEQTINRSASDLLQLYRPSSVIGDSIKIRSFHHDSNSTKIETANIDFEIQGNTPDAVNSDVKIQVRNAGALVDAFRLKANGNLEIAKSSTNKAIFNIQSLTGARNYYLPNADAYILGKGATDGSLTMRGLGAYPQGIEFGPDDSTEQSAYFDWHTKNGDGDYRSRLVRNSGVNGSFDFIQTGDGGFTFNDQIFLNNKALRNAVVSAHDNTLELVAQAPHYKRWGAAVPASGATTGTTMNLMGALYNSSLVGAGTCNTSFDTTEGVYASLTSGATAGNNAGIISPTTGAGAGRRLFNMRALTRFQLSSTSTGRLFFGFTSATALPNNAQPLAVADHGFIVGFNETGSGSTNWSVFHNDGATSATVDDITGPIAKDALWHTIEILLTSAGGYVSFDGTWQTISTDLPSTSSNLFFNCVAQASTTTAKTLNTKGVWFEATK